MLHASRTGDIASPCLSEPRHVPGLRPPPRNTVPFLSASVPPSLPHGVPLLVRGLPSGRGLGGVFQLQFDRGVARLGAGGCAAVFPAIWYGCEVAAKVLSDSPPRGLLSVAARDSLDNELRILPRLRHDRIVAYRRYMHLAEEGLHVLLMERMAGTVKRVLTLAALHGVPVCPHTVLTIGLHATEALMYVHDEGIVHGDVKPANLLLSSAPVVVDAGTPGGPAVVLAPGTLVKLGDFGEALDLTDDTEPPSRGYTRGYLAPEWDGALEPSARPAPARDQFALGKVLSELLDAPYSSNCRHSTRERLPEVAGLARRLMDHPAARPTAVAARTVLLLAHHTLKATEGNHSPAIPLYSTPSPSSRASPSLRLWSPEARHEPSQSGSFTWPAVPRPLVVGAASCGGGSGSSAAVAAQPEVPPLPPPPPLPSSPLPPRATTVAPSPPPTPPRHTGASA